MHPLFRFSGPFRWLVLSFCLFGCGVIASAQTVSTITGKVYSPYGPTNGDPIPNILVFVAQAPVVPFKSDPNVGPGVTGGCTAQANLVSGNPLVSALTDAGGNFTLTSANMPNPANIVIQAGKWRQQFPNTPINVGGTTTLQLSMPGAQSSTAELPHIAIVTGYVDAVECIFRQIGIADSEFTDPSGTGSINLYKGSADGGSVISSSTPGEAALVGSPATLSSYDVVMFGCQGTPTQPLATTGPFPNANQINLINFANSGGRLFTTHYEYVWLDTDQPFESAATWKTTTPSTTNTVATIDQTYPEGAVLAQWIQNVGASYNNTLGQIELANVDANTSAVNNPPAQSWVKLNSDDVSMQFTFDTPVGATGVPTVSITFSSSTVNFSQGDAADSVTINATNNSATAADSTLTMSIALPGGITATSLAGGTGTGWTCNISTLICSRAITGQALAAGASDPVTLVFSIAPTASVGQASITASLSGGGLSGTNQCGRVLYNDYHVENTSDKSTTYPNECKTLPGSTPGTATAQEKFLEFSLYNLSNFVSPSTTDLIVIHGPVTLAWPQPAAIQYGTALSATQLDATATDLDSNTTVPGAFAYTPVAGAILAASSTCPNLSVAFTPTDATDYNSATATACLEVDPDATTTAATNPSPSIYYGQVIASASVEGVVSNGPGTVDGGNLLFYIDGVLSCTLQATVGGGCPPPSGVGYNAGTYTIQAKYSGDSNFLASSSALETVIVNPDPTTTTLTSPTSTAPPGQSITFNASVADTYYNPVSGTMAFYDGTNLIASVPVTAQNTATYSSSNLLIGVHGIKACFVSAINSSNTYNFANTCSAPISEVIQLPATISTTTTVLASSLNPSVFAQSVTFTATAATTGAFISEATGTINFYDGTILIGSGTLTNGTTTFTTAALAVGLHSITAGYIGSATMAPSTSAVVPQQVNTSLASAESGFIMSVSPTTFSTAPGGYTSIAVSIFELNNFNTPVTLTCEGLPSEASCNFGNATIPATGGATVATVGISAPHSCGTNSPYSAQSERRGLPILAFVTFLFFARRRRGLKGLVLAAILCIIPAISGCGNCTDLGVRPGTYTFTIKATANSATPVTVGVPGETVSGTTVTQTQAMTMIVMP